MGNMIQRMGARVLSVLVLMLAAVTSSAQTVELILRDSSEVAFEQVYRNQTLALRDPHVFALVPVFGCSDFTDTPIPLTTLSLNNQIATALSTDSDGDGLLDLSPLLALDRFDPASIGQMMTQTNGLCPIPVPPMMCAIDQTTLPPATASGNDMLNTCLTAVAGTTSGYTPGVSEATAPCFVTAESAFSVAFADLVIPLSAARTAATWNAGGDNLTNGLIRGFLRESDADLIPLPADLPLIGGQPLSSILPGGTGNCAAGDDRDQFNGEIGWWFYLEFSAEPVDFILMSGP